VERIFSKIKSRSIFISKDYFMSRFKILSRKKDKIYYLFVGKANPDKSFGWDHYVDRFDKISTAIHLAEKIKAVQYQIVDTVTTEVIKEVR